MPKLLWVSPLSVHDTSSTSATQMRNMLLSLKARDVDIVGLSALNFVNEKGTSMFSDLEEKLKSQENSFNLNDNNITFIYVRTKSRHLGDMVSQEQRNFYAKFCSIINAFRPDVVMGSGSDMLSMVCFDEAKRRGIPTAYVLLDGTPRRFNFPNIDVVLTDSRAIANLYAQQYHINVVVAGSFLPITSPLLAAKAEEEQKKAEENEGSASADATANKDGADNDKAVKGSEDKKGKAKTAKDDKKEPKRNRITMINPSLEKGVAIFARLAQLASKDTKGYKFAVYETYEGQFKQQIEQVHQKGSDKKAFSAADLNKIEVLGPQVKNTELLATTKLLVVPSLSFEGIVNIAREAIACGIPVLATNQMGLAESIGEAGVLVEMPAYCIADNRVAPEPEDMANCLKGLQLGLSEDFSERCANVSKRYDVNLSANRLALILKPLFDQRAGNNPQLLRNGSLI